MTSIYEELNNIDDNESLTNIEEELLTEATVPMYREMLFNILLAVSNDDNFKKFILENKSIIQFHHLDGVYEGVFRKKASNNNHENIAIVTRNAHNRITKLNKTATTTQEKRANARRIQAELRNEVFFLADYVPRVIAQSISEEVPNELTTV